MDLRGRGGCSWKVWRRFRLSSGRPGRGGEHDGAHVGRGRWGAGGGAVAEVEGVDAVLGDGGGEEGGSIMELGGLVEMGDRVLMLGGQCSIVQQDSVQ